MNVFVAPPARPEELREYIAAHCYKRDFFQLVARSFPGDELAYRRIETAYTYFAERFRGQLRDSGGSYMNGHLVPVAVLQLGYWQIRNVEMVIAALGHDAIEDIRGETKVTLIQRFGSEVAHLVDGSTKPPLKGRAKHSPMYARATFRKVQLYGQRVVILKCLGDRLHNMLTLWGSPEKKQRKIVETRRHVLRILRRRYLPTTELESAMKEQWARSHINDRLC